MRRRVLLALVLAFLCAGLWPAQAQQPATMPLTMVTDYWVKPGMDEEFMNLVRLVGGHVRDKLMADGVIFAWGIDVPMLRSPGQPTHSIWVAAPNWAAIEKLQKGMAARLAELAEADKKAGENARKNRTQVPKTTQQRANDVFEMEKTKDWLFQDVEMSPHGPPPPAGATGYAWINSFQLNPGKSVADYRAAWNKYNRPVFDKLMKEGTIAGYAVTVEAMKSTNDFTHFVIYVSADMSARDKLSEAFAADRAARTSEERAAIAALFTSISNPAATRNFGLRTIHLRVAGQK